MSLATTPIVGRTIDESSPGWPPVLRAKEGSPNVIFWVMDDSGFGNFSPFGGMVDMPTLRRIADSGLRFTNFHTTALCSPTRSCLMTGRNHHSNHMAAITEIATGYPGYDGNIPFENGFLSEMLAPAGYTSWAVGKWHLTPENQANLAASRDRWPLGRGFDRYYGFLGGDTDQYYPELVSDSQFVEPPKSPEDGYHLSEDLVDKSLEYIKDLRAVSASKPFFLYLAFGANHSPHQVPAEWRERYAGQFDAGWDAYRETVFQRQLDMGLLPEGTALSERDPDVAAWDSLSDDEHRLFTRQMENFAGFSTHMDHQVGRLLDFLETIGELDNTIVMCVSDNGASAEGGPIGMLGFEFQNRIPVTIDSLLERYDDIGGPDTFPHYSWGWAWAGNTPFRRWKRETYRGGTADPLVVSWPAGIDAHGEIRNQFTHAIDLVPTVLEAAGIEPPETIRGVTQSPIQGTSFAYAFDDANSPEKHITQYHEMFGHRALYHNGWRAVCPWPGPSFTEAGAGFGTEMKSTDLDRIEGNGWELYNMAKDPAETNNLAAEHPGILRDLISRWWTEAGKYDVLPLDGRAQTRYLDPKPEIDEPRSRYVYYPGSGSVPAASAVNVRNRPHSIGAEVVIPEGGANGVLLASGWRFGGYSFYVKDNKLCYAYNFAGHEEFRIVSDSEIPSGKFFLSFEFEATSKPVLKEGKGASGIGRLYINREKIGEGEIPNTMPMMYGWGATLSCGRDLGSSASSDYTSPFAFDGVLHQVIVDVSGEPYEDLEAESVAAMMRQ